MKYYHCYFLRFLILVPLFSGRAKKYVVLHTAQDDLVSLWFRLFFCFLEAELLLEIKLSICSLEIKIVRKMAAQYEVTFISFFLPGPG